jgi:hypothetical protein
MINCAYRFSPQIPGCIPRISVGFRHQVEVDLNGMIRLCDLVDYRRTVSPQTWEVLSCLAHELRRKNVKASFFNATPQGGGGNHYLIIIIELLVFRMIISLLIGHLQQNSRIDAPCSYSSLPYLGPRCQLVRGEALARNIRHYETKVS